MRRLLLLVVCAAAVVAAFRVARPAADAPADGLTASVASAGPSIEYRDERPRNIFAVPPAGMPEALRASYRLRPDRRVLLAVPALHALATAEAEPALVATGETEPALTVDFRDGGWQLIRHDRVVGELPELASFEDAWTLLTGVASATPFTNATSRGDLAPVRAALDEFSVRHLAHACPSCSVRS